MALSYASVDLCLVVVILALNIVPGSRALNAEDFKYDRLHSRVHACVKTLLELVSLTSKIMKLIPEVL